MSVDATIRPAEPEDAGLVLALVKELAEYEKLAHEVHATEADYRRALFGEQPYAEALLAEVEGQAVGFALFFHNFSTFVGKPGIYLEDLYVRPELRGKGIGKALLKAVVRLAAARGCGRVEWAVLDWNEPAIRFYKSLGARPMSDWTIFRLDERGIDAVASEK